MEGIGLWHRYTTIAALAGASVDDSGPLPVDGVDLFTVWGPHSLHRFDRALCLVSHLDLCGW